MRKSKPQKPETPPASTSPVMVMPRQTHDDILRRREIREALHDLKAKIVRGKQR